MSGYSPDGIQTSKWESVCLTGGKMAVQLYHEHTDECPDDPLDRSSACSKHLYRYSGIGQAYALVSSHLTNVLYQK